jgi:tRNA(Ile)-lysidine synthase
MANSRKSLPLNNPSSSLDAVFQRALEEILARVVASARVDGTERKERTDHIERISRIALAYSGGLDSSVLLHLAAAACRQRGIQLFAFHVHHGLSTNADHWLTHCEAQAQQAGVSFASRRVQIDPHNKLGTEQAARQARYEALSDICNEHEVQLLLTAHHQDDQTETVLLQLLRGAGLPGLSAMAMLQMEHALLGEGIALGRPLLEITRADIEAFAELNAISHIVDESNEDIRFRRNGIRHQLMPLLERELPGAQQSIARSTGHLQSAQKLLDELAMIDLQACAEAGVTDAGATDTGAVDKGAADVLVIDRLRQLSEERLDNLLRYWLKHCGAEHYPSDAQLLQLCEQMLHAREDAHPLLTLCGLMLERRAGRLVASRSTQSTPFPTEPPQDIVLHWQGEPEIPIPAWQGRLVFESGGGPGLDRAQLLRGPLRLCARRGGERLQLDTKRPSRTLKNLFQESDVPARERCGLPLLYLGDELVFVAGLGTDARVGQVSEGIRLRWQPDA